MEQTQPIFLIRKYRSILKAAIVIETVSFFVSMTDSIIGGNLIGTEAFNAISLTGPLTLICLFFTSILNSGTLMLYTFYVGRSEKKHADAVFSQGCMTGAAAGAVYAVLLYLAGGSLIEMLAGTGEMAGYLRDYYGIILFFYAILPLSFILDNIVCCDGGEKWSTICNLIQIVANIFLSIILGRAWGIRGIAVASSLSRALYLFLILLWFFSKRSGVRFSVQRSLPDLPEIIRRGSVRASVYAMSALAAFFLNQFIVRQYDMDTATVLFITQRFLGITTVFIGLATAVQPMIGILLGEKNTKAIRSLMRYAGRTMTAAGVAFAVLAVLAAPLMVRLFGVEAADGALYESCCTAVRLTCAILPFEAVMTLFFVYYASIRSPGFALPLVFLKDHLAEAAIPILGALLVESHNGVIVGLVVGHMLAFLLFAAAGQLFFFKKGFPLMLSLEDDEKSYIYDFELSRDNILAMVDTAKELMSRHSASARTSMLVQLCLEDLLLLIEEKNKSVAKPVLAECTLILEGDSVRLILRDDGVIFDLADEDVRIDSLRQYIVTGIITLTQARSYMTVTGFNRSEYLFSLK